MTSKISLDLIEDFTQPDLNAIPQSLEERLTQYVYVEDFGAVGFTQAELIAFNGNLPADTELNNVLAYAAAQAAIAARGGGFVLAHKQFYVLNARINRLDGVYILGSGVGQWEPIYPQRAKTWTGTTILFRGIGEANVQFPGITSMRYGGGRITDPDDVSDIDLWSAYNSDADDVTPATLKSFSVAVLVDTKRYGGLANLRICNWVGVDGISDWSNQALGSTEAALGDNWHFGYVLRNSEYCDDYNIQVVGGFREAAHAQIITIANDNGSERNRIVRAKFQSVRGMIIRSPDRWAVTTPSATEVQITRWSEESYWDSTGSFRGSDNVTYTYSGSVRVGDALKLTGVNPNPQAAGVFHIRVASPGYGNTSYEDVYSYGLDHQNGAFATTFGYMQSRAMEISGFPLRGIKFRNCKWHTREKVLNQIHDATDLTFIDCQWEGTAFVIVSAAFNDITYRTEAAPAGETRNFLSFGEVGLIEQDLRLFRPRSGYITSLQSGGALSGDNELKPFRDDKSVVIFEGDGTEYLRGIVQEWTPSLRFVTVTHTSQEGFYHRVGDVIFFSVMISYTGLDTADTSQFDISLPITPDITKPIVAQFNERLSSGLNLSTLTRPFPDISTGPGLGLSHNRTTRIAYNTAGVVAATGDIHVTGHYWAA